MNLLKNPLSPRRLRLAAVLVLFLSGAVKHVEGDEKDPAPPSDAVEIGVFVEYIELDRATAGRLVRGHDGDGSALRRKLQALLDGGKAEILESTYLLTRSSVRSRISAVDEFLYPTEYDPPDGPDKITGKVAPGVDLEIPANPTAFDSRDTGHTFEVDAEVSVGGDLISLNLSANLVEHVGEIAYGDGAYHVAQPQFDVLSCRSNIVVSSGNYALLSVHTPRALPVKEIEVKRDPSRRVFVMVRATILKRGQEPGKPERGAGADAE